eukprot:g5711.t1
MIDGIPLSTLLEVYYKDLKRREKNRLATKKYRATEKGKEANLKSNWYTTEPLTYILREEPDPQESTLYPKSGGLNFVNKKPLWNVDNGDLSTFLTAGDPTTGAGGIQGYRWEIKAPPNHPRNKLMCMMGITTEDTLNFETNNNLDANSDWSRLQSRVVYGVRVDENAELIVCKSRIAKFGELEPNTTEFSQTATGVNIFDASGNAKNMKIMMRPIFDNGYKLELLYNKDNQANYTSLATLSVTDIDGDYPIYHKLHLYQVASFENETMFPLECKAIHHGEPNGNASPSTVPTKAAMGFGYEKLDSRDTHNVRWLDWMNDYGNAKTLLGFTDNSYSFNFPLEADYISPNEVSFTNPNILINVLGLPIESRVGSCNSGQQSSTIAVASTENQNSAPGFNSRHIFSSSNFENWLHLRNKEPITITRLGIHLTDVELKDIDCLDKSSTVWLKFSGDDEKSYKLS